MAARTKIVLLVLLFVFAIIMAKAEADLSNHGAETSNVVDKGSFSTLPSRRALPQVACCRFCNKFANCSKKCRHQFCWQRA
ncbi:hypothetical protein LIER_03170 [Lithospermum erythrorhizon]|uniref:Uncharacterized protein n=1 Tax=Lithospermum erythrorhizon TaxID=34254 RepID=A0AAV3NS67_LITER